MHNPSSWATLTALGGVYHALGAPEMAAKTMEQAKAIKPRDANVLTTLGIIYAAEREYELARESYQEAVAIEPNLEPAAIGLGWAYSSLGQTVESASVFETLYKRGLRTLDVLHGLSDLPAPLVSIDLLTAVEKLDLDFGKDKDDFENTVAFIRAIALDKAGRHVETWQTLLEANRRMFALKARERQQRREREQAALARLRTGSINPYADRDEKEQAISLFILGPSRSGKTSMEQLVDTLPGVKRGHESPIIDNAVRHTFQSASLLPGSFFESLPAQLDDQCRKLYAAELTRRAGSAKVFTNTHPAAIYDAARIAASLPNVRFIFMKRNLPDVLLRIYMRKYSQGNSYAYDLRSAQDHVNSYYEMADLLSTRLPHHARVINYEDMIANPLAALRVAADLCNLPLPKGVPAIGDDRGCAAPYLEMMGSELAG
jgi:tetratricopeptide (TPR) repeat protein